MKFKIDRERLLAVLGAAAAVVGRRTEQPILKCVSLRAEGEGLECKATNLVTTLIETTSAAVVRSGGLGVDAQMLLAATRALAGDDVELEAHDNHWLTIRSGRAVFSIAGQAEGEFGEKPSRDGGTPTSKAALATLIDRVMPSVSTDAARINLNGALLESDGKRATMVSTDGNRLTKASLDMACPKLSQGVLIPRQGLLDLRRMVAGNGEIRMMVDGRDMIVRTAADQPDAACLVIRMTEAVFPPYAQVIPKSHDHAVIVGRDDLSAALHRMAVMTTTEAARPDRVELTVDKGKMLLAADNLTSGKAQEDLAVEGSGTMEVAMQRRFLLEAVGVVGTREVELRFQTNARGKPPKPVVVVPVDGADIVVVVMPMKW